MALYGYGRVSTTGQDFTIQHEALRAVGCQVIRSEKKTGTKREGRTELDLLIEFLREGDTLVVTRIDRLARSMKDLQDIVHELKGRGVALKATEQPIDTGSAAGKAFLDMLGRVRRIRDEPAPGAPDEGDRGAKSQGRLQGAARNNRPGRDPTFVPRREARACRHRTTSRRGKIIHLPGRTGAELRHCCCR